MRKLLVISLALAIVTAFTAAPAVAASGEGPFRPPGSAPSSDTDMGVST
jgi:hypothetical protein